MKKTAALVFIVFLLVSPSLAHAGYWKNLGHNVNRGIKNMVSFPLEIPIAIGEHHRHEGYPAIKHFRGLSDGIFKAVNRMASGFWDIPAGLTPGVQEGFPVDPETLF